MPEASPDIALNQTPVLCAWDLATRAEHFARRMPMLVRAMLVPADAPPGLRLLVRTMLAFGGNLQPASAELRERLAEACAAARLPNAKTALARLPAPPEPPEEADDEAALATHLAIYLAPEAAFYQAEARYDRALRGLAEGDWDGARKALAGAWKTYHEVGGVAQLAAADCLLNLSACSLALGQWERALPQAATAQLLYEQWGQSAEAARAALNRSVALIELSRWRPAPVCCEQGLALAERTAQPTLLADFQCLRIRLAAESRPRPSLRQELAALSGHYERDEPPGRARAYERLRRQVGEKVALANAQRTMVVILRHAAQAGTAKPLDKLPPLLRQHPELTRLLTASSFLERSETAWAVLYRAAQRAHELPEVGDVPELGELIRCLELWLRELAGEQPDLREWAPSALLTPRPRRLSADASERLLELAKPWRQAWQGNWSELQCLGDLHLQAACDAVAAEDLELAGRQFTEALTCLPDWPPRFARRALRLSPPQRRQAAELALASLPRECFPGAHDHQRRLLARLFRPSRQRSPSPEEVA